ncbi:MAG: tetratricopeptide repeat protein, partial [Bacteroidales bacterium]
MTKKIFIVALALLGTFEIGFSQSKLVKTATKNLSSQSLDKAVEAINEAIKDPESMYSANTWIVRGRVYMGVAANAFFARNYVNAEDSAYASFLKALELDLSDKNQILVSLEWPKLALAYYNKGADKFQEKKYNEATSAFEKSAVLSEKNGALDTSAIFNIALSAANDDQLEKAAEKYQFLVDCKYPMMGIYTGLGDVYFRLDKKKEAEQIAALLVERFGEDSIAYTSAAAINLRLGNNEKAEKILSEALAKWATTPSLYLYIGIAYENGNQENKAEAAYKKALELNPEYKEAVYNLGAFYVNKG